MERGMNQTPASEARLGMLLDKLVAAQLELEPIHKGKPFGAAGREGEGIALAYFVLRSAITDLRGIIQQIDGMPSR
jgi:hypothetical protein